MQRKFIKDMKSWECFFLTMFRRLQGSNTKFRCIQHCDTLNLQNNACLCNHFRLTVNIPNKRFLISDYVREWVCNYLNKNICDIVINPHHIPNPSWDNLPLKCLLTSLIKEMMTSLHAFMSEKLRATETCNYLHINGIDIFDVSQGYCVTSRLNHAHIMMDTMQHLWR